MDVSSAPISLITCCVRDDEGWLNPGEGLFGEYLESLHRLPAEHWSDVTDHMDTLWTQTHPVLHSDAALPPQLHGQSGIQLDTEQQGLSETLAMSALLLGCLEEREALRALVGRPCA